MSPEQGRLAQEQGELGEAVPGERRVSWMLVLTRVGGLWVKSDPCSPTYWSKRGPWSSPAGTWSSPESRGSDWLGLSLERPPTTSDLRCPGITRNCSARAQPGSATAGCGP